MLRKWINKLLGISPVDYKALLEKGAIIVDVRTEVEYRNGHMVKSVNIPLQELNQRLRELNPLVPIIVCCASGVRSASAKGMLERAGFKAYNGGSWKNLKHKIE